MIRDDTSISEQQNETSFSEPGTSTQNQVAIPDTNYSVVRVSRQFSDDEWSTSDEGEGKQVAAIRPHAPNENAVKIFNRYSDCTGITATVRNTTIYKDGVTVNNNFYCCPSTLDHVLNWCTIGRKITFLVTVLGIALIIFLGLWIPSLKASKTSDAVATTEITGIKFTTEMPRSTTTIVPIISTPSTMSTIIISTSTDSLNSDSTEISNIDLKMIKRRDWGAVPPTSPHLELFYLPPKYVIFSETETETCTTTEKCTEIVRNIQATQMKNGYDDIAYNFVIGGDGMIYEGRGWDVHPNYKNFESELYDDMCTTVSFIGKFDIDPPTKIMLQSAKRFLEFGSQNDKLFKSPRLKCLRQLSETVKNPGDKLYEIIKTWNGWDNETLLISLTFDTDRILPGREKRQVMITNSAPIEEQQNETSFIEAAGPSSQNQVALPVANNSIVHILELSSGDEWSSSDEEDGRQVAQIRPQATTENRVQVKNTFSDCTSVNPTVNNSTIYKDGATINNNYYCCSLSIDYVGNWCKKRRRIVIIALSVLAIVLTISLAIWISIGLSKTEQSDNTESETTVIMQSTETSSTTQETTLSTIVTSPSSTDSTSSTTTISTSTDSTSDPTIQDVRIVSRADWNARPSNGEKPLSVLPVNLIIIMHTGQTACFEQSRCAQAVRGVQGIDMEIRGKTDISYNWLVGGDGLVYTGRGWDIEGDHTKGYDNRTIGIAFIGNFETVLPTSAQIDESKKLIRRGVDEKWIEKGYKIVGKKQCVHSLDPGEELYNIIKDWPEWSPTCDIY